ncbi:MAG: hypothetical protein ABIX12_10725 [Rubrivivax sp.]
MRVAPRSRDVPACHSPFDRNPMTHCTRLLFAAALALVALRADAQGIASAAFETPVDRYGISRSAGRTSTPA